MAGHPKLWAAHPTLDAHGEEKVFELRASGISVRKLATLLGVTPRQMYHWFDKGEGHDVPGETGVNRRERWNHANTLCAQALVDGAKDVFERLRDPETGRMKVDVSREEIALAKAETDFDRWHASTLDRDTFGEKKGQQAISIGELHLTAVKRVSAEVKKALPTGEPDVEVVVDAEEVTE